MILATGWAYFCAPERFFGQIEPYSFAKLDRGVIVRKTLKDMCEFLEISYNTAKVKQDKVGGITLWIVSDSVFEIWKESVK